MPPPIAEKTPAPRSAREKPVRWIRPEGRRRVLASLGELHASCGLLLTFTLREIKVRYKQTLLGVAWAVLQPLALVFVFTVVFSRFARIPSDGVPYPAFSYAALLPWTFFSTSLTFAVASVVAHASLVEKVYFPREVLPAASILAALLDFAIAAAVLAALLAHYGLAPGTAALYVPLVILVQVVFTYGIALFLSALNVYYRDVKYAIPLVMQVWLYASPVIYPVSLVPERWRAAYMLNPMAGIVESYRRTLLHGLPPDARDLGLAAAVALVLCYLGYRYFKRVEIAFADVI